jgi:hypothetical protein
VPDSREFKGRTRTNTRTDSSASSLSSMALPVAVESPLGIERAWRLGLALARAFSKRVDEIAYDRTSCLICWCVPRPAAVALSGRPPRLQLFAPALHVFTALSCRLHAPQCVVRHELPPPAALTLHRVPRGCVVPPTRAHTPCCDDTFLLLVIASDTPLPSGLCFGGA